MTTALLVGYVAVAFVAAGVVYVASGRLVDERQPVAHRLGLSVAAGGVWPVILLGLAEFSSFAIYAKAHQHDEKSERVLVEV